MAMKQLVQSMMRKLGLIERPNSLQFDEKSLMLLGESLLSAKMALWDSEQLPFIPANWDEYGFGVFSQNNEDGLLQYIIHHTVLPY